jgi:hypothetical protein
VREVSILEPCGSAQRWWRELAEVAPRLYLIVDNGLSSAGLSPIASAKLISAALLVGLATKKLSIEMEEPGAGPLAHVVPEEFLCSAGTNTLKLPVSPTYRNGFSRVAGLCFNVVYGGFGKDCGGAPITPEKT